MMKRFIFVISFISLVSIKQSYARWATEMKEIVPCFIEETVFYFYEPSFEVNTRVSVVDGGRFIFDGKQYNFNKTFEIKRGSSVITFNIEGRSGDRRSRGGKSAEHLHIQVSYKNETQTVISTSLGNISIEDLFQDSADIATSEAYEISIPEDKDFRSSLSYAVLVKRRSFVLKCGTRLSEKEVLVRLYNDRYEKRKP